MKNIEVGKTYKAKGQGVTITPQVTDVTVVWVDEAGDAVHYRKPPETAVRQTTIARFKEIVGLS